MLNVDDFLSAVRDWHASPAAFSFLERSEAAVLLLACGNLSPVKFSTPPGRSARTRTDATSDEKSDKHEIFFSEAGESDGDDDDDDGRPDGNAVRCAAARKRADATTEIIKHKKNNKIKKNKKQKATSAPAVSLVLRSACCQRSLRLCEGRRRQVLCGAAAFAASGRLGGALLRHATTEAENGSLSSSFCSFCSSSSSSSSFSSSSSSSEFEKKKETATTTTTTTVAFFPPSLLLSFLRSAHQNGCQWGPFETASSLLLSPVNPRGVGDSLIVRWRCAAVQLSLSQTKRAETAPTAVRVLLPRGRPPSALRGCVDDAYNAFFLSDVAFAEREVETATAEKKGRHDEPEEEEEEEEKEEEEGSCREERVKLRAHEPAAPLLRYVGSSADPRLLTLLFAPRTREIGGSRRLLTYKRRREVEAAAGMGGEEEEADDRRRQEVTLATLEDRIRWHLALLLTMLGLEIVPLSSRTVDGQDEAECGDCSREETGLEEVVGWTVRCGYCAARPAIQREEKTVESTAEDEQPTTEQEHAATERSGADAFHEDGGEKAVQAAETEATGVATARRRLKTVTYHLSLDVTRCDHCRCCPWKSLFLDTALRPPRGTSGDSASLATSRDLSFTFDVPAATLSSTVEEPSQSSLEAADRSCNESGQDEDGSAGAGGEGAAMHASPSTPASASDTSCISEGLTTGGDSVKAHEVREGGEAPDGTAKGDSDGCDEDIAATSGGGERPSGDDDGAAGNEDVGTEEVDEAVPLVVSCETRFRLVFHIDMSTVERLIICWRASEDAEKRFRTEYLHHPLPKVMLHDIRPFQIGDAVDQGSKAGSSSLSVETFLKNLRAKLDTQPPASSLPSSPALFYNACPNSAETVVQLATKAMDLLHDSRNDKGDRATEPSEQQQEKKRTLRRLLEQGKTLLLSPSTENNDSGDGGFDAFRRAVAEAVPAFRQPTAEAVPLAIPGDATGLSADAVAEVIYSLYQTFLPAIECRAQENADDDMVVTVEASEGQRRGQPQPQPRDADAAARDTTLATAFLEELRRKATLAATTSATTSATTVPAATKPQVPSSQPPKQPFASKQNPVSAFRRQPPPPHQQKQPLRPWQQHPQHPEPTPFLRETQAPAPAQPIVHVGFVPTAQQQAAATMVSVGTAAPMHAGGGSGFTAAPQHRAPAQTAFQLSSQAKPFFPAGTAPPVTATANSSNSNSNSGSGGGGGLLGSTKPAFSAATGVASARVSSPFASAGLSPQRQQQQQQQQRQQWTRAESRPSLFGSPTAAAPSSVFGGSGGGSNRAGASVFGASNTFAAPSTGGGGVLPAPPVSGSLQPQQQQQRRGGGGKYGRGRFGGGGGGRR